MKNVKVVVACRNASGAPDMVLFDFVVSRAEYENGDHYEKAEAKANDHGYDAPFLCYDETEFRAITSMASRIMGVA